MFIDESICLLQIMGNWTSCCSYSSPLSRRKDANGAVNEFAQEGEESVGNLQHISEREHDDWNTDPSVHPKVATIFLERSKVESKRLILLSHLLSISNTNELYFDFIIAMKVYPNCIT